MSYHISIKEQQKLQGVATFSLLGSVAAGKSSLVKCLSGVTTQKFKNERIDGRTVHMGYVQCKIYGNEYGKYLCNPKVIPEGYELLRHFSIADNPGHNAYMATLLTGTTNIDCGIFLISGTDGIEPQTIQHMRCFKATEATNLAFAVSKVDLVPTKMKLNSVISDIDSLMESEELNEDIDPPIIPVSINSKVNLDMIIKYLLTLPYPRNLIQNVNKPFAMTVMRSFDINKPGAPLDQIQGAVIGGSIYQGCVAKGDIICILPGIVKNNTYTPLVTQVIEIRSDTNPMDIALPGGFIAIKTTIDPIHAKQNSLVGTVVIKIKSPADLDNTNLGCKIVNKVFVQDINYLDKTSTLVNGNKYVSVIHGYVTNCTYNGNTDDIHTFDLEEPVAVLDNEKIAIMTQNASNSSNELVCYGTICDSEADENMTMIKQFDLNEFFEDLPIKEESPDKILKSEITEIVLDDDLVDHPEFAAYTNDIYNIDKLIDNITFSQHLFSIDCPSIMLAKSTTSISITNASILIGKFTDDQSTFTTLINEFAHAIKNHFKDDLSTARMLIDCDKIAFHDVRRTSKKFFVPEFNKIYNSFIESKFTCKTCRMVGSVFMEKKKHYCKACKAIIMSNSKLRDVDNEVEIVSRK